jgi:hypothetical protein
MTISRLPWRATALVLLGAALSIGVSGTAHAEGDNGTVKVHAVGTPQEDNRDQPHVCRFYLDAFGFDGQQSVYWSINGIPPTDASRTQVAQDTLTLAADGTGRTGDMSLPDGHYKLYWKFVGENGRAKQKAFWVDCTESSASPSPGAGTSGSPGPVPSGSVSATPSSGVVGGASVSPSPVSGGSSLPVTGTPLVMLAGVAAALIGAGVLLRVRAGRLPWWRR